MLGKRFTAALGAPGTTPDGGASLILADVRLRGDLVSGGDVQFDGHLDGNLRARGVTLGEGAQITGEVVAETLRVRGTVEGTIRADRVELAPSAVVRGDILHGSLRVEGGARVDGRVCCLENPTRRAGGEDGDDRDAFPEAKLREELTAAAGRRAAGAPADGHAPDIAPAAPQSDEDEGARKVA